MADPLNCRMLIGRLRWLKSEPQRYVHESDEEQVLMALDPIEFCFARDTVPGKKIKHVDLYQHRREFFPSVPRKVVVMVAAGVRDCTPHSYRACWRSFRSCPPEKEREPPTCRHFLLISSTFPRPSYLCFSYSRTYLNLHCYTKIQAKEWCQKKI
jgi:hypothetical protein